MILLVNCIAFNPISAQKMQEKKSADVKQITQSDSNCTEVLRRLEKCDPKHLLLTVGSY